MKNVFKQIGIFLGIVDDKKPKFNPNPIDRDGDGIVQEGTKFERPAEKKPTPAKKPAAKKSATPKKK
jgi:hypothetical protein